VTVVARRLHQLPGSTHPPDEKVAALTFEDAPGPDTAPVLDALAACRARGTFFVVGANTDAAPDLLRRIVGEGHAIGNQSWSGTRLEELGDAAITDAFARVDARLTQFTGGAVTRLARPPSSMAQAPRLATLVAPLGYTAVVGWSIDAADGQGRDASTITGQVVEELHPGAIVRIHAGAGTPGSGTGSATANAVARIVRAGRVLGYRFITL
jgi:peptidoglycan/xylan/chitin deacetylase (PgdA/CDA1 family)